MTIEETSKLVNTSLKVAGFVLDCTAIKAISESDMTRGMKFVCGFPFVYSIWTALYKFCNEDITVSIPNQNSETEGT